MARILLADDEASTRDLLVRSLGADGHTVVSVEDGQEALDRLKAAPSDVDLLISDVQMPLLDGIALAARALELNPALRIILMSAHAEGVANAASLTPRLSSVVMKPFTLDDMRQHVRKALG